MFVCSTWRQQSKGDISSIVLVDRYAILRHQHGRQLSPWRATGSYRRLCRQKSEHLPCVVDKSNDWIKEYNIRVGFRNQLNSEANKALGNPTLYNKLVELRTAQETTLNNLKAAISKLAVPVNY
jgi:hypothetical protein